MKLAVYVVAAFGAGLAGALYFVGNLRISPDAAFSVNWTAFAIFMVVIGGIGRIEGPIVGALIFFALNKLFSDYGTWYLLGLGALAIVVTIFFKQGLWGFVQQRWGWSKPHRPCLKKIDRKSTRLNSSHANISYAVFCLKKKKNADPIAAQRTCILLSVDRHMTR